VGDKVAAHVNVARRERTMRNHSATHLMHKALREVLGPHVQQKGSLVDPDKTRFDFSHDAPMTEAQTRAVEAKVNAEILRNEATTARIMKYDDAVKGGAMALFGEKYDDEVRVLDIGSSRELSASRPFCTSTPDRAASIRRWSRSRRNRACLVRPDEPIRAASDSRCPRTERRRTARRSGSARRSCRTIQTTRSPTVRIRARKS